MIGAIFIKLGRAPAIKANRLVDVKDGQILYFIDKILINQVHYWADGGLKIPRSCISKMKSLEQD